MKNSIPLLFVLCFLNLSFSQNEKCFSEINRQVWDKFTKAFETLDYKLFASIHSKDLIRVNGDNKTIRDSKSYLEGYKNRWENSKRNYTISFRFTERICNDNTSSERGIYKLTVKTENKKDKNYYGKFHVFLKKENSEWKIIIDYDSSENNSITEKTYQYAFAIDDFDKYKKTQD